MWRPLHPDVVRIDTELPDGTPVRVLTEVLTPDTDGPTPVWHDDGSLTVTDGARTRTFDARAAEKLELLFQTPVTEDEVLAGAAEAVQATAWSR
ncbi:hypothetical protein ACU686_26460 [Yinghuangia aomiensis]